VKPNMNKRGRRERRPVMAADEYRERIQALVDEARADLSIAERLAEEARQRFGAEIDVPPETE
jgi:hypothetical protein